VAQVVGAKRFVFWVHRLEPKLDPGDRNELTELVLPQLGLSVKVETAHYTLEETGTEVQRQTFWITQVRCGPAPATPRRQTAS